MEDKEINEILEENEIVAVVGCSRDEEKDAHKVPRFLQNKGYKIIPVNPYAEEILGKKSYSSLKEIEGDFDIVEVFRPSEVVYEIVEEALDTEADVIWMQLGIKNNNARDLAEKNGLKVVQDRCMLQEYKRLFGD